VQDFKCILFFVSIANAVGAAVILQSLAGCTSFNAGCSRLFDPLDTSVAKKALDNRTPGVRRGVL